MTELSGFPYGEVRFTREGEVYDASDVEAALAMIREASGLTDLLVISHGWNNDMNEARKLYAALAERLRAELDGRRQTPRRLGVLGVLWPSKKFAERDLIPGGAASAVAATLDTSVLREQLDRFRQALDADVDSLAAEGAPTDGDSSAGGSLRGLEELLPLLEDSPRARRELADRIRAALPRDSADGEDASDAFFQTEPEDLMDRLGGPLLLGQRLEGGQGGTADTGVTGGAASLGVSGGSAAAMTGGALGLGQALTGARAAASRLLNFATYYVMKDRAGRVGWGGLTLVLQRVRTERPDLALHLAGHSFGARVVASAVSAATLDPPVASLTLLQAAFSHNGFAVPDGKRAEGAFRNLLTGGKVKGPVVVTCTRNDLAVGIAYPLASRIARQNNSGLGDRNDPYGGLGRNGAVSTPEAVDEFLLPGSGMYTFRAGAVHNLRSDDFISSHGDITGAEVAHALVAAMGH